MMKKILPTAVLSCFLLSQPLSAFAQEPANKLSEAILEAKSILAIDENDWQEFDYSSYETEDGVRYQLRWENNNDRGESISAEIDQTGHIYRYNYYANNERTGLSPLRLTTAQGEADGYLKKMLPQLAQNFILVEQNGNNDAFIFTYQQMRDNVPIQNAHAVISVDKFTKQITQYYLTDTVDWQQESFPDKNNAISLTKALEAWEKQLGVELVYRSYYDYQNKNTTIFPAYQVKNTDEVIDALTGQSISLMETNGPIAYNASKQESVRDTAAGSAENGGSLSPQEQNAVENMRNLKTKEQADNATRNLLAHHLTLENAYLTKNQDNRYLWRLSYSDDNQSNSLNATVDAQSGQVLSFYRYQKNDLPEKPTLKSHQDCQKLADDFLKKAAPDQLKQSRLVNDTDVNDDDRYSTIHYQRLVNGIVFVDDGLSVVVDRATGQIISYNLNWLFNAEFPAIDQIKTIGEITQILADLGEYQLIYVNGKDNRLIYDFYQQGIYYLDPFTGKRLDWRGLPYQSSQTTVYQWQGNHAFIEQAEQLRENGIYLNDSQIDCAQTMTQSQLMLLLYRSRIPYQSVTEDEMYQTLTNWGVITKAEIAPTALLSREEGAKYLIRLLGYDKLVQKADLFRYPYTDEGNAALKGYVALAGGLGLLTVADDAIKPQAPLSIMDGFYGVYQALNQ